MAHRVITAFVLALAAAAPPQSAERPTQPAQTPAPAPPAGSFRFLEAGSRSMDVALTRAGDAIRFTWPAATPAEWDTALLGVDVRANADAPLPYVEIASGTTIDRQYFRPGEEGARWLNLSLARGSVAPGAEVTLREHGVTIASTSAPLRLFTNRLDLTRPILVVAPHPDDAEIAAFGIYAWRNATVVTVTAGNAGPQSYGSAVADPAAHYQFKGMLRVIDSVTVPWLGGIPPARAFNLGYFDARLAEMHDAPEKVVPEMYGPNTDIGVYLKYNVGTLLPNRARASTWTHLVDDLERVLKKVRPAIIVTPHPQLDSHRDHQFTSVALAQALQRWRRPVTLLLYTNHADQNRYPYGPAGTIASIPPPTAEHVIFDRVYSHPVPPETQRLKLFALEAMHDLRPSPSRIYQLVVGDDRAVTPEKPDSTGGLAYLRRGPRSNELFFVYDRQTMMPVIESFVAAWRARPVSR